MILKNNSGGNTMDNLKELKESIQLPKAKYVIKTITIEEDVYNKFCEYAEKSSLRKREFTTLMFKTIIDKLEK